MNSQLNNANLKTVLNWSSGKDAAMAFYTLQRNNSYKVTHLLTTVNNEHNRVVMHGIRESLLDEQAKRMQLPLIKVKLPAAPDDEQYRAAMEQTFVQLKKEGIVASAFGDIFLEDLKTYREEQLARVGIKGIFPLWEKNTRELVREVQRAGIEAMIVCVNEKFLGKEFLGRKIDEMLLKDLPPNVDPCGENGEFHTFVYNAPFFTAPVPIIKGEIVYKAYTPAVNDPDKWNTGFYFLDLLLD
ncbi:MAG TPA: diphthine--ammonia ligase [Flavipsychrobacter sp.]|nr:diphthine--ammonia ligase [Flavipsychrobacter sp.]